jgi:SAM-dependent methyltransferase
MSASRECHVTFYAQFADQYERVFPFRPATLAFLQERLPTRGLVLDLGCGTGHYAGALAADHLDVIGVDLDESMITAARTRYGGARFAVADLAEIATIADRAAGAFCIGNVLPHLDPCRRDAFLADLARILAAGAPWIVQTVNADRLLPLGHPHDFPPLEPTADLVFQRRYEPASDGSVIFRTALERQGEVLFAGEATLWLAASTDLAAAHAAAGFDLVEQKGNFTGEEFDPARSGGCVQVYRRRTG